MGLYVHSLNNIPKSENRDYLIYLLEYGWHEPLGEALSKNFDQMAAKAAKSRSVVIRGTELAHFENEVFSWHQINNERDEKILPAILDSHSRRPENQPKFSTYVTFHEKETADKNEKTSAIARMSG